MAASAWVIYNSAKKYLGAGQIDLLTPGNNVLRMSLHTSASNASTVTLSRFSQLTAEIADGNGYSTSGKPFTYTWSIGASASEMRLTGNAIVWSAAGGSISAIKYAVLWVAGASGLAHKLLCVSQLSTAAFAVTTGNTLTITPSANGIFELN